MFKLKETVWYKSNGKYTKTFNSSCSILRMKRQVRENLYIGDKFAGENASDFEKVVTLAPKELEHSTDTFLIEDSDEHDYETFKAAVYQIIEYIKQDKKTLVHCNSGISRSVSATAAALAVLEENTVESAVYDCEARGDRPKFALLNSAKKFNIEYQS